MENFEKPESTAGNQSNVYMHLHEHSFLYESLLVSFVSLWNQYY